MPIIFPKIVPVIFAASARPGGKTKRWPSRSVNVPQSGAGALRGRDAAKCPRMYSDARQKSSPKPVPGLRMTRFEHTSQPTLGSWLGPGATSRLARAWLRAGVVAHGWEFGLWGPSL